MKGQQRCYLARQEGMQKAICSGVGVLRPTTLVALLDDAQGLELLQVDMTGDLIPGCTPSSLMWAQWAGASNAARVMLDQGLTLSNSDLEGLRRLGRARRQAEEGSAGSLLMEPSSLRGSSVSC